MFIIFPERSQDTKFEQSHRRRLSKPRRFTARLPQRVMVHVGDERMNMTPMLASVVTRKVAGALPWVLGAALVIGLLLLVKHMNSCPKCRTRLRSWRRLPLPEKDRLSKNLSAEQIAELDENGGEVCLTCNASMSWDDDDGGPVDPIARAEAQSVTRTMQQIERGMRQ